MLTYSQKRQTIRKTFNISAVNTERMGRFLSPRKQTEFVNRALALELDKLERQQKLALLSNKINSIQRVKASEPVVSTIERIRSVRDASLSNSSCLLT